MTKHLGLLGFGIGYSLSPKLHGAALAACGLDWDYSLLDTEPDDFPGVVDKLRGPDWVGVNVTVPYKQKVIPMLDAVDDNARLIGAVNTIVNSRGKLTGYNTDSMGLARDLHRLGIDLGNKDLVVAGAGGGAAAVLALAERSRVTIICRHKEQGAILARRLNRAVQILPWESPPQQCDVLINCTPPHSGWKKHAEAAGMIYDLNYHDDELLLDKYHSGLGMLVYQGALSFQLWTGLEPVQAMAAAVGLHIV